MSEARTSRAARSVPLILATLLLVLPAPSPTIHVTKLLALSVIFAINVHWGEPRVWYAFALFLVVTAVSFVPSLHTWNAMVVPATAFAIVAYARPKWVAGDRWLLRGQGSRATWVLSALTVPLAALVLIAWAQFAQPDLSVYADMVPVSDIGLIVGAAIVFSLFNAIAEEVAFRGVIWQALSDTGISAGLVLITQAAAFGLFHFNGVPSGWAGVALSTIYGLALGGTRWLSKGLLAPVIVHLFADLTIFLLVIRLAEQG